MTPIHHLILAVADDATYYSGWDKAGAVAVAVAMLGVMVTLLTVVIRMHKGGISRLNEVSDRHMAFVEKQVAVLTDLKASNDSMKDSAQSMHRRIDVMLSCRYGGCPVKRFLTDPEKAEN